MTEDWLLENLSEGWSYDCTFNPEPAFIIMAPEQGSFLIPLRFLKDPKEINEQKHSVKV